MEWIGGLLCNKILISAFAAWLAAQLIKTALYTLMHRRFDPRRLLGDGGMPSSHSAAVTAAATACGVLLGPDSAIFALAVLLAFITCHDAMHSRQEIGKQAAVIRELAKEREDGIDDALAEFVGHTPIQVAAGIVLGVVSGLLVSLL